jgi:DNA gyrase subunit B
VGVSVVNALSDWLDLRIWRDGKEHYARFENGDTAIPLTSCATPAGEKGTEVRFLASAKTHRPDGTFSNLDYSFKTLENRLRELAFLNSGVKITLEDNRGAELLRAELFYEGGVKEFVKYLDRSSPRPCPTPSTSRASAAASASRSRCGGTTPTTRRCCPSPTTSPSATAAPTSRGSARR